MVGMVMVVVVVVVYWPSQNIGKNAPTWLEPILAVPTTHHPLAALSGETKITMHQSEAVGGGGGGRGEGRRQGRARKDIDGSLATVVLLGVLVFLWINF